MNVKELKDWLKAVSDEQEVRIVASNSCGDNVNTQIDEVVIFENIVILVGEER